MKFTTEQNEERKQFVVRLFTKKPALTNVEVQQRVLSAYGTGMVSERISDFRKEAQDLQAEANALHPAPAPKRIRKKQVVRKVEVAVEGRAERPTYNLIQRKLPVEVQDALVALKASVSQYYRTGGISMNLGDAGELIVKYEFEPKDPIRGDITL